MEGNEPEHNTKSHLQRIAQVSAGIWIEEPLYFFGAALQPNLVGLVRPFGFENSIHLITRMGTFRGLCEFISAHARTRPR